MTFTSLLSGMTVGQAAAVPALGSQSMLSMLPLLLMAVAMYFILIRPMSKQKKQHASFLNALKKDDGVVTNGGVLGRVITVEDKIVTLEIADKVKVKILRDRIAGSAKSALEPQETKKKA